MRCPICDFENPMHSTTCARCGSLLPEETAETSKHRDSILDTAASEKIRCSYCWYLNPSGNDLCEVCGMPLRYVPTGDGEEGGDFPKETFSESAPGSGETPIGTEDGPVSFGTAVGNVVDALRGAAAAWSGSGRKGRLTDAEKTELERELRRREQREKREKQEAERMRIEESQKRSTDTAVPSNKIRCRNCWFDNPWGTKVCKNCGTELQKPRPRRRTDSAQGPRKCPVCGHENLPGVTVCLICKVRLDRFT